MTASEAVECSFCRAPKDRVAILIVGPNCTICPACVALCVHILAEGLAGRARREIVGEPATLTPEPKP